MSGGLVESIVSRLLWFLQSDDWTGQVDEAFWLVD